MKLFHQAKDGGPDSNVTGYWLIESKMFFSIALLRFSRGSRENYHNHAFNAISWILKGNLLEYVKTNSTRESLHDLMPSLLPVITTRNRMHKVYGCANATWAITFRGPWANTWKEYAPKLKQFITLTHGRKIVNYENSSN